MEGLVTTAYEPPCGVFGKEVKERVVRGRNRPAKACLPRFPWLKVGQTDCLREEIIGETHAGTRLGSVSTETAEGLTYGQ